MAVITKFEFINKSKNRVRSYLRSLYKGDFVIKTRNILFDFVVLRLNEDVLVKIVYEHEIKSIDEIKKVFQSGKYKDSFLKKKFFICYYLNDNTFQLIHIN